jgi:hypothetical protein
MSVAQGSARPPTVKRRTVSTFRRVLWHVNRTDLGWVVKGALKTVRYRALSKRRQFADKLPRSSALTVKAAHLKEMGHVDVSDIVSLELARAAAAHAQAKVARADDLAAKQQLGHKSFWLSLLDEDLVGGKFPSDHPFVRYALQTPVLRILADHMHTLPQLSDVLLTLSRPTDEKLSYSQLWHLDHDDKQVCKLFIYLTDVQSRADGPFTFIDAKQSASFRNTLRSHMSDDAVMTKVGKSNVHEIIAPRLSSFIVDTAKCLHMGSRIQPGRSRLLYTATYFPPPRIYPEPPNRFHPIGELSPLERAVLAL